MSTAIRRQSRCQNVAQSELKARNYRRNNAASIGRCSIFLKQWKQPSAACTTVSLIILFFRCVCLLLKSIRALAKNLNVRRADESVFFIFFLSLSTPTKNSQTLRLNCTIFKGHKFRGIGWKWARARKEQLLPRYRDKLSETSSAELN